MRVVGRIDDLLYLNIDGARIMMAFKMDWYQKHDVVSYADIPVYSNIYFLELDVYGMSDYKPQEPVTLDDKNILTIVNNHRNGTT